MSYRIDLGDIAERYNERTGAKVIYSVMKLKYSGYDEEYIIYTRRPDSDEPIAEIMSLWSSEATRLADILTGKAEE